jgi:HEAT repeat protein
MVSELQNKDYNELIKFLFNDEKWEVRAEAARQIGLTSDARATNLLYKALNKEKDEVVINRIIEAMGRIKDAKATMPIVEFLKKELEKEIHDKQRLFVIVESLMKIGDKRALTQLGILYESCEGDIKKLTEEAFSCIDSNWKVNIQKA